MSAIAILDYGGANELFNQMSALAKKGRADYQLYYNEEEGNENSDIDAVVSSHSDLPAQMQMQYMPSVANVFYKHRSCTPIEHQTC